MLFKEIERLLYFPFLCIWVHIADVLVSLLVNSILNY